MAAKKRISQKTSKKKRSPKKPNLTVVKGGKNRENVTAAKHNDALVGAYNHFNKTLFKGELPGAIVTCGKLSKRTRGVFRPESWVDHDGNKQNEICLNSNLMRIRAKNIMKAIKLIFSTLVHEMCHEWQQEFGNPSRSGYHNAEWARKMEEVGLTPSSTGKKGGKKTGQRVTHFITSGGVFEEALADLREEFKLPFLGLFTQPKQSAGGYLKYVCPSCNACVRGKPELNIRCDDCDLAFQVEIA